MSGPDPELQWAETRPGAPVTFDGQVWRTADGRYAIVRTVLPEDRPGWTAVYTLRKISEEAGSAWPGTLGYFLAERYTLYEAQQAAANDAYRDAHWEEASIQEDFPALRVARFWWPISQGITKGGLAIVRDGDRLAARVVGMARSEDAYRPATYAEIGLGHLGHLA